MLFVWNYHEFEVILRKSIAFQGVEGANSHLAIHQYYGNDIDIVPCEDLHQLFNALKENQVQYALLPVENALAGAVHGAYELLRENDFRIQAEIILRVHHNLLALKGTKIDQLTHIRSHPQALAQCEQFLKRHNLTPVNWYDTAGAARDLSGSEDKSIGAIASSLAAELYDLDTIESNIEDVDFNFTRFFVLGHDDPVASSYNKTSIVFATRNRPSALYNCLGAFSKRNINLTKIESRPRRNRPWEPIFYLDFEGHWQDPASQEALLDLLQQASFVKMLGSYPAVQSESVGI